MTETSRVQKLLIEQNAEIDRLKNRIEQLEAALREIVSLSLCIKSAAAVLKEKKDAR